VIRWLRRQWRRPRTAAARQEAYWARRRDLAYYREVLRLARLHAPSASSVIDVGSMNSPFVQQFDWIPEKVSLDLERRGRLRGVRSVRADFMRYEVGRFYDLVLCLQVLEHQPEPRLFAQRLLQCGRTVIVSVPHRWPRGLEPTHLHDPIDEDVLRGWLGSPWLDRALVTEHDGIERLIAVVAGNRARTEA
jgi:hypothetical protein